MQHTTKSVYEKICIAMTGLAWVAGLLIAGSDNTCMPWINGLGLILFFLASLILGKLLRASQPVSTLVVFQKFYPRTKTKSKTVKKNSRVNIRYALEAR